MPLPAKEGGYTSLHVKKENGETAVTLSGNVKTLSFSIQGETGEDNSGNWQGKLQVIPNELSEDNKALSIAFSANSTYTDYTDDNTREHAITTYDVAIEPDLSHLDENDASRAYYQDFGAITGTITTHFRSKNAQSSPTTLEIGADLTFDNAKLNAQLTMKSTSPWTVSAVSTTNTQSLADMTDEQKTELANQFWANLLTLAAETATPATEDLPLPEESTATDLATVTDTATSTDLP